jgi:hypothetical protein
MRALPEVLLVAAALAGCSLPGPVNPSFPLAVEEATAALDEMAKEPKPLSRPVIVLGGFLDPGLGPWWFARPLRRAVSDPERIATESFFFTCTFDDCRARLIERVDAEFPSDDPVWTAEVDVIAMSMGGLVARHAAAPPGPLVESPRRLRIARLFTLSTPHRGANLAGMPVLHPLQEDMRYGSDFLRALDAAYHAADYEVYAYVQLGDFLVGAENASPFAEAPWWMPGGPFGLAHIEGAIDPRAQADIARRLRGDAPYATRPAAPLP